MPCDPVPSWLRGLSSKGGKTVLLSTRDICFPARTVLAWQLHASGQHLRGQARHSMGLAGSSQSVTSALRVFMSAMQGMNMWVSWTTVRMLLCVLRLQAGKAAKKDLLHAFSEEALDAAGARRDAPPFAVVSSTTMDLSVGRCAF